jgi:hypothetical protein
MWKNVVIKTITVCNKIQEKILGWGNFLGDGPQF